MRSLAAEAESTAKSTAGGSSSSTASSAGVRTGSASDKEDAAPDQVGARMDTQSAFGVANPASMTVTTGRDAQLPRLSTSIANDGAMWEMYGPVVNSLLLDALHALSQLAERREVRYRRFVRRHQPATELN